MEKAGLYNASHFCLEMPINATKTRYMMIGRGMKQLLCPILQFTHQPYFDFPPAPLPVVGNYHHKNKNTFFLNS